MNNLRLMTKARHDGLFDVYWMTGEMTKGVIEVQMPDIDDAGTAAELAIARTLLVERNVCGHNKTGAGLRLFISRGAILKLVKQTSSKRHLAPYALFLLTRFVGAACEFDDTHGSWISDDLVRERIEFDAPPPAECVTVGTFGDVEVTMHVVERYRQHFNVKAERAWLALATAAKEAVPAEQKGRPAIMDAKHRKLGRYAFNRARNIVFVVVPPDTVGGKPRLATLYPPDRAIVAMA